MAKDASDRSDVQGAQLVSRVCAIIREVAGSTPAGIRLVDVERRLRLQRPTAHRILRALVAEGMLRQDAVTKRYHVDALLPDLSVAANPLLDLRAVAHEALRRIARETGDTVYLTIRHGFESVCLERLEGDYPVKTLTVDVGGRRPLGTNAGGLALMTRMAPAEVEAVLRNNSGSYPAYYGYSEAKARALLARARGLGYVLSESDILPEATAVGVAIRRPDGRALAALSVVTIASRMPEGRRAEIAALLIREADAIGRSVGG